MVFVLTVIIGTISGCGFVPPDVDLDPGDGDGSGPDAGVPGDPGGDAGAPVDPIRLACQQAVADLRFTWDAGDEGWTHDRMPEVAEYSTQFWPFEHWERGTASSGPGACNSGAGCWATNLDNNYVSCQRGYLESPEMDLSECATLDIGLVFFQSFDFWSGRVNGIDRFDGGIVEVSGDGGVTWQSIGEDSYNGTIDINPSMRSGLTTYACVDNDEFHVDDQPGYVQQSDGWHRTQLEIPADVRTDTFRVRFVYSGGVAFPTAEPSVTMQHTEPGWYLDDLSVELPE